MRVVRASDGRVLVDTGQKRAQGRGLYLCRTVQCVELAVKRQTIRRALGTEVSSHIYDELRDLAMRLRVDAE